MKKRLLLITTGGTIVSEPTERGLAPLLAAERLTQFVPELADRYDICVHPVMNIESPDLLPAQWEAMVEPICAHYGEYDGFVVVHGTDTLAYTAAALNYMVQNAAVPIVITGAQYPIEDAVTDGKKNLWDSCVFAAESGMAGVYVVFSGHVIRGARAKKLRTKSYDAFGSVNCPEAGAGEEGVPVLCDRPEIPTEPVSFYRRMEDRVLLLKLYPGIRAEDFAFVGDRYRAVYIESYGVGGLPAGFISLIKSWKERGAIVVIGTQALYEGTDLGVYTVGHTLLTELGCIQSLDMTSEAVMAKLMYALGRYSDTRQVERELLRRIGGDIASV